MQAITVDSNAYFTILNLCCHNKAQEDSHIEVCEWLKIQYFFKICPLHCILFSAARRNSTLSHFLLRCDLHAQNLNACVFTSRRHSEVQFNASREQTLSFSLSVPHFLQALEKQNVYFMRKRLSNWWVKIDSSDWQTLFSILSFCSVCCSNK